MRSILIYLAIPIACLGPAALYGQPRMQLTLAEAQRLAIQNNPSFYCREVQRRGRLSGGAPIQGCVRAEPVR